MRSCPDTDIDPTNIIVWVHFGKAMTEKNPKVTANKDIKTHDSMLPQLKACLCLNMLTRLLAAGCFLKGHEDECLPITNAKGLASAVTELGRRQEKGLSHSPLG